MPKTTSQELADLSQFITDQLAANAAQVKINTDQAALITQLQNQIAGGSSTLSPVDKALLDQLDATAIANDPSLTPPAVVATPVPTPAPGSTSSADTTATTSGAPATTAPTDTPPSA